MKVLTDSENFPVTWEQRFIESPTGRISLYCVFPDKARSGSPRAVIQICHGLAEHAARYGRFAQALARAGYAVFAHDHPGHGKTELAGTAPGYFGPDNGWEQVIETTRLVNDTIRQTCDAIPVVNFGHSMGSIVAFNFALRYHERCAGLALWNAGVDAGTLARVYGMILKTERFFKGSDVPGTMAKKLTFDTWNRQFAPNRTTADWLSRDRAEVDRYIADPDCGFDVSIGAWLDILRGIWFAADDANLKKLNRDMPVSLLAGDDDPCTENGQAVARIEDRMKRSGMKDVTFELLKETRHESLNELNRDDTTGLFINWLDARFA